MNRIGVNVGLHLQILQYLCPPCRTDPRVQPDHFLLDCDIGALVIAVLIHIQRVVQANDPHVLDQVIAEYIVLESPVLVEIFGVVPLQFLFAFERFVPTDGFDLRRGQGLCENETVDNPDGLPYFVTAEAFTLHMQNVVVQRLIPAVSLFHTYERDFPIRAGLEP